MKLLSPSSTISNLALGFAVLVSINTTRLIHQVSLVSIKPLLIYHSIFLLSSSKLKCRSCRSATIVIVCDPGERYCYISHINIVKYSIEMDAWESLEAGHTDLPMGADMGRVAGGALRRRPNSHFCSQFC